MSDNDIVCECNSVEVKDVKDYIKENDTKNMDLVEILEDLCIGTRCSCCDSQDCPRIDVHYSEILK
jgi:bacterioferritin-associated ferredoxin